jgi:hypothetical protein
MAHAVLTFGDAMGIALRGIVVIFSPKM